MKSTNKLWGMLDCLVVERPLMTFTPSKLLSGYKTLIHIIKNKEGIKQLTNSNNQGT